jgi:histone chaperone ASF1
VTALLLTCSYKGKEFVRVGYYVNVEYTDPELLIPDRPLPNPPIIDKLQVRSAACASCADVNP